MRDQFRPDEPPPTVVLRPTVIVADDDDAVRQALSDLVSDRDDLVVVGVADSGEGAASLCARHRPDLAVVDVMMPGGGAEAIAAIQAVSPATSVVVYTARADRRTRERMLAAGAWEVVVKGGSHDIADVLADVASRRRQG